MAVNHALTRILDPRAGAHRESSALLDLEHPQRSRVGGEGECDPAQPEPPAARSYQAQERERQPHEKPGPRQHHPEVEQQREAMRPIHAEESRICDEGRYRAGGSDDGDPAGAQLAQPGLLMNQLASTSQEPDGLGRDRALRSGQLKRFEALHVLLDCCAGRRLPGARAKSSHEALYQAEDEPDVVCAPAPPCPTIVPSCCCP